MKRPGGIDSHLPHIWARHRTYGEKKEKHIEQNQENWVLVPALCLIGASATGQAIKLL